MPVAGHPLRPAFLVRRSAQRNNNVDRGRDLIYWNVPTQETTDPVRRVACLA
jgi:hypothetical protein